MAAVTPRKQQLPQRAYTPPRLKKPPCEGWINPPFYNVLCGRRSEVVAVHPSGFTGLISAVCRRCAEDPQWVATYGEWRQLPIPSPEAQTLIK